MKKWSDEEINTLIEYGNSPDLLPTDPMKIMAEMIQQLLDERRIYSAKNTAWLSGKEYLVYVSGHGWTDGVYHTEHGWCHKWALTTEAYSMDNHGVLYFMEPPPPKETT